MPSTRVRTTRGFYGAKQLDSPCAYCAKHRLAMTVNMLKKRNCLGRECNALRRNPEHQYWTEREKVKRQRQERRQRLEEQYLAATEGR